MKKFLKYLFSGLFVLLLVFTCCVSLTGCRAEDVIQHNLLVDTGNFKTYRNIKVINVRSDKVLMEFEGYLTSKIDSEGDVNIMIKTGPDTYKLHYVRLAQEITYISEQLENTHTDPYHWKITIYAVIPQVSNPE